MFHCANKFDVLGHYSTEVTKNMLDTSYTWNFHGDSNVHKRLCDGLSFVVNANSNKTFECNGKLMDKSIADMIRKFYRVPCPKSSKRTNEMVRRLVKSLESYPKQFHKNLTRKFHVHPQLHEPLIQYLISNKHISVDEKGRYQVAGSK